MSKSNILTVLQAIQLSTEYLEEKGIDSPRVNSELMLAHILKCKRLDLYLKFDRPLKAEEVELLRGFISRRGKFEPLQYILGEVEFYGLRFEVSPSVLIPRAETELLVEEAIKLCSSNEIKSILDIGTGSGNIPISIAKNVNGVDITSIDISKDAIQIATKNAEINEVMQKTLFINEGIETFKNNIKYDMIISNPPYVSIDEYPNLQKEIVDFEPKTAVTDNSDGYSFYEKIITRSKELLNPGGHLLFEVAKGQSNHIKKKMSEENYSDVRVIKDYQNIDRIIIGKII